ncbi:hypothetical protein [Altericista sp. CCNU0014]|uniref:hypothetical protein n=1 Tax=Altericista sp. CCNU0014 TaxID=3082949 RepID=UPI00385007E6
MFRIPSRLAVGLWIGLCLCTILIVPIARWNRVTTLDAAQTPIQFAVSDRRLNPVDARLFGHLLERASFGEPGPESALMPNSAWLQPQAVARMKQMNIPVIRFPGAPTSNT